MAARSPPEEGFRSNVYGRSTSPGAEGGGVFRVTFPVSCGAHLRRLSAVVEGAGSSGQIATSNAEFRSGAEVEQPLGRREAHAQVQAVNVLEVLGLFGVSPP
jgi:hypothetical protein